MRRFVRLPPPQYLIDNWEKWGNSYAKQKIAKLKYTFQWKMYNKQKVNHLLLPILREQTQEHCSYCDHYPPQPSDETVDHFYPKGILEFYALAYQWENLYFCCADCQWIRMEQFDLALLRPDGLDFSFERYFIIDSVASFEIRPNPQANSDDQNSANTTIRLFNLNHKGRCASRRKSWQLYFKLPEIERDINDFAFRYLFD